MNELDEIKGSVGPITVIRLNDQQIVAQVHPEREDGCAAMLDLEDCKELVDVIVRVAGIMAPALPASPTLHPKTFHEELQERAGAAAHLKYSPKRHTGLAVWLAKQSGLHQMTTGRYLKGESLPLKHIAARFSELLDWPMEYMVLSIIESSLGRDIRRVTKKYSVTSAK